MNFLAFVAVIVLGYVLYKFINEDSDKKNTNKNSEEFDNLYNPSDSRSEHQKTSVFMLASKLNCSFTSVREHFIQSMKEDGHTMQEVIEVRGIFSKKKYEEAKVFGIHPDDTPSGLLERWAKEYSRDLYSNQPFFNEINYEE